MATRRKKKAEPAEPAPFTVGEPEAEATSSPEGEPAAIGDETADGIVAFRSHIESAAPSLLWPLHRSLPSMQQYLSDLDSADEAVNRLAVRHSLSNGKLAELSRWLLEDAYAFNFIVSNHREITPEVHMAMAYAGAGQAQKLAWLITQSGFDGYVIEQFREACQAKGINPYAAGDVYQLERALQWQNQRYVRGWFKSSVISDGCMTLRGTLDPNESILILCAKEDKAFEIVRQIGDTVTSGRYADLYPDRVPPKRPLKDEVIFGGRTVSSREKTVQGFSCISNEIGGHFSIICTDDIVVRDARGGIIGGGVGGQSIRWLHGMHSLHVKTRPFWRLHLGTINDIEDDDHAWLTKSRRGKFVFTVVVPGERYDNGEYPDNVFERGVPTVPSFYPEAKIEEALNAMVNDPDEVDGVEAFRSDVWLAPMPKGGRLFLMEIVNDPDRTWMGPYEHPKAELRKQSKDIDYTKRFMVARVDRNDNAKRKVMAFDPWEDMDRVMALHTTWSDGAKRWAATVVASDSDMVRFQLETRIGDNGVAEWPTALAELHETYKPRVIGMERKAYNDPVVQNLLRTDKTLRRLRGKIVAVDLSDTIEEARIRTAIAEPLKAYRLLLLAASNDPLGDYGAAVTRRAMLSYRAGSETPWPLLESIAMADSLTLRVPTRAQREKIAQRRREAERKYTSNINPAFGVPSAA